MNIRNICLNQTAPVRTSFGNKADNVEQNNTKGVDKTNSSSRILFALGGLAAIGAAAFLLSRDRGSSKAAASGESIVKQANAAAETVQASQDNTLDTALKIVKEISQQSAGELKAGAESVMEKAASMLDEDKAAQRMVTSGESIVRQVNATAATAEKIQDEGSSAVLKTAEELEEQISAGVSKGETSGLNTEAQRQLNFSNLFKGLQTEGRQLQAGSAASALKDNVYVPYSDAVTSKVKNNDLEIITQPEIGCGVDDSCFGMSKSGEDYYSKMIEQDALDAQTGLNGFQAGIGYGGGYDYTGGYDYSGGPGLYGSGFGGMF